MKGGTDAHVFLFSGASAVFAKSDSLKIFSYGLEVQQGTVLGRGREKTQHYEAIVIPTSGRQNTVGCLTH